MFVDAPWAPRSHGGRPPQHPRALIPFPCVQTIRFEGSQEEFQLVVEASSAPVAVFPAEALTDLRCCVFGKLYLKKVRLGMSWQTGSGSRLSLAFRGRIAWFYPALPCRTIGSPFNQLGKSFVSGLLRLVRISFLGV